jgi:uncharacterized protein
VEENRRMAEQASGAALAEPVSQRERISSLDVLRGFALLGILVMNISDFALPENFDYDPTVVGPISRVTLILWAGRFVLFEGKMRALFSMLFGAGVILLTSRLEKRGEAAISGDIFLRRNMWLTLIGVLHAYFLWWGDILYFYGMSALLFLYPCRKLKAKTLLIAGIAVVLTVVVYRGVRFEQRSHLAGRAAVAATLQANGKPLADEQKDDLKAWQTVLQNSHPDRQAVDKEIAEMRGGYVSVFKHNWPIVFAEQASGFYRLGFCDSLGMMLIGMGLLRLGLLSGRLSNRAYVWTAIAGYAIGLPLGALSTWQVWRHNFDVLTIGRWEFLPYDLQRIAVAVATASIIVLVVKAGALKWMTKPIAAVGQTALSNYVGTTVICILLFDGYGLGLFAKLQFYQLFYVVGAVWLFNLVASTVWLKHFQFGPIEWIWRSLTYWKRQPMIRSADLAPLNVVALAPIEK